MNPTPSQIGAVEPALPAPSYPTRQEPAINYHFLHRGSLLVNTPAGIMRLDLYQRRSFARLSLRN